MEDREHKEEEQSTPPSSPYRAAMESRFVIAPVDLTTSVDAVEHPVTKDDHEIESIAEELMFRTRAGSITSQLTQSDLSWIGIITSLGDAGSLLGSSVLLSTPSYLGICPEIKKSQIVFKDGPPISMEYLDTIMENAEYIDTAKGKLPLAEAARMIAQDRSYREELFNKSHIKKVHKECYKKLACIGFSFLCLFTSFVALRNLQTSSTSDDPSLGLITFGCLASLMWMGGVASNTVMYHIRPKWSLVTASVPFILYNLAHFYPVNYTLIPGALLVGVGNGMIWASEGVYMINLAATYAMVSRKPLMEVIGKFNALIFTMHQSSHVFGNLLSSVLLDESIFESTSDTVNTSVTTSNITHEIRLYCGVKFYQFSETADMAKKGNIDPQQLTILYTVLAILALIGSLNLTILLRPLKTPKVAGNSNLLKNLLSFTKMFGKPQIWFLTPLMAYLGFSASIIMADYTKAFISCAYGVKYIGYTLLAGSSFSVAGAFISGRLVHLTGRLPIFLFATVVSSSACLVMNFWRPTDQHISIVAFVPICLWCLGDGILIIQLNGYLGELFRNELPYALSTLHMWYGIGSLGSTLPTAFRVLQLTSKLYMAVTHVWLAFILIPILEILIKTRRI